jgi:hypothetical protein
VQLKRTPRFGFEDDEDDDVEEGGKGGDEGEDEWHMS